MNRFAAALLASLLMGGAAQAAKPMFGNLSLEQAAPGDGADRPLNWQVWEFGVKVTRECAPRCALRFSGERREQYAIANQWVAVDGTQAGRRVVLSGRLRSEGFEGNVLPSVGATVNGQQIVSEFADADKPRGTTDWREFKTSLPIVAGATKIGIGIMVAGRGSVWVDSLDVRFEDGAPLTAPEVKLPPRPAPSQALLDDDALRLAASSIPAVSDAWRTDVLARRQAIRSLFSDDFSDLQFLKPLLEGKRVVQLGENGHGVAEFNWMKVRLVKFLHQELGYDVIAFESSLPQCFDADAAAARLKANMLMAHCIFSIWATSEVLPLFDYIKQSRAGGKPLTLAGFDTQFSAVHLVKQGERLHDMLAAVDSPLAAQAKELLTQLSRNPATADKRLPAFLQEAAAVLDKHRSRLGDKGYAAAVIDLKIQSLRSWQRLIEQVSAPRTGNASDNVRDEGMAANLNFLLDTLYPGRKVIVWAHNNHIAYDKGPGKFTSMGAHLARKRKDELYTIGLYMGRGAAAQNDGAHYAIAPAGAGSLEAVLANGGWKYSFVDLKADAKAWPNLPMNVRDWGTAAEVITPARSYDGLIYIDTVTPPDRL